MIRKNILEHINTHLVSTSTKPRNITRQHLQHIVKSPCYTLSTFQRHLPIYINALIYDFLYFTNIKLHETAATLEHGVLGKLNLCS